jgi:hypothetical protein
LLRACHLAGGLRLRRRPADENEIAYQARNYPFFLWASGGLFSEFMIHQVDECCWVKDDWPVSARGIGGRSPGTENSGQNFDGYPLPTSGHWAEVLAERARHDEAHPRSRRR